MAPSAGTASSRTGVRRLIWAALGVAVGTMIGWLLSDQVWGRLTHPYAAESSEACSLSVCGSLDDHLKIAVAVGLVLSSPIWLRQLYAFVAPSCMTITGA